MRLIGARWAVSVTNSAHPQADVKPGDPYVTVSEESHGELVERLGKIHPRFAHYTYSLAACGGGCPQSERSSSGCKRTRVRSSILDVDTKNSASWFAIFGGWQHVSRS